MTHAQEMATARLIAGGSPDPSTKVGATIIRNGLALGVGYNALKPGIPESPGIWQNRELKLASVRHAEIMAIDSALEWYPDCKDATMYIWGLPPCDDCARAIVRVGIKRLIYTFAKPGVPLNDYWKVKCRLARKILVDGGVQVKHIVWPKPKKVEHR